MNRNNTFFRLPEGALHLGKFCRRYEKIQKKATPKSEALEYVRFESKAGTAYAVATDGRSLACLYWKLDTDERLRTPVHVHHSNMSILEDDGDTPSIEEKEDTYVSRAGTAVVHKNNSVEYPNWRFTIEQCFTDPATEKTIDLSITERWIRFVTKFGTRPNVKMWIRKGVILAPYRLDGVTALADGTKAIFVQMPTIEPSEYILPTFT